jgi:NADH-quinone oxidoreductase subunit G
VTEMVAVRTERGSITVPVEITDIPDRVVWLPLGSAGCAVHRELGVGPGALVTIEPAATDATGATEPAAGDATKDSGGAA